MPTRPGLLVASIAITVCACSIPPFERTPCEADLDCADAFPGAGATCNIAAGGYCEVPEGSVCEDNADCRSRPEFGFGYQCTEGACMPVAMLPRCATTLPERLLVPGEYSDAVVLGSIVERAYDGDAVLENAARLVVEQANEAGGIADRQVGVVFCDMSEDAALDSLTLDEAAEATAIYLQDVLGVPAIHGPTTSGATELVFEALRDTETLIMSPSATSPDLTLLDTTNATDDAPGLLWRTVPPDSVQGQTIADDMAARGTTSVVVVAENGSYGVGLQNFFVDVFRAGGGTIAGELLPFSDGGQRDAAIAAAAGLLADDTAQEILFISGSIEDTIEFLNAAAVDDAFAPTAENPKGIFLTDTAKTGDIFTETRPEVADILGRVRLTAPSPGQGAVFDTFAGAYAARFPEDPRDFGFLPQAYDAVWLLVYGAAWSVFQDGGVLSGTNIGHGLRRISGGTPVNISGATWRAIRSSFEAGNSVDVTGSSGPLDFDPNTEELLTASIDLLAVVDCDDEPAFEVIGVGGEVPDCE